MRCLIAVEENVHRRTGGVFKVEALAAFHGSGNGGIEADIRIAGWPGVMVALGYFYLILTAAEQGVVKGCSDLANPAAGLQFISVSVYYAGG